MADFRLKWPPRPRLDELFIRLDKGEVEITPDFFHDLLERFEYDSPQIGPFGCDEWEALDAGERNMADIVARATPEWLIVMAQMITNPPLWLVSIAPDRIGSVSHWESRISLTFVCLFDELVAHFKQNGHDILILLLNDATKSFHILRGLAPHIHSPEAYFTDLGIQPK